MKFWIIVLVSAVAYSSQQQFEDAEEASSFSCEDRVTGYYADLTTGCRTYHYCSGRNRYTYHCPNNTLFQQRIFICNHWYLVDCDISERYYDANLLIGQKDKPFVGTDEGDGSAVTGSVVLTTARATRPGETNEATSTTEATTTTVSAERNTSAVDENPPRIGKSDLAHGSPLEGFIRVSLSDPRQFFYIPEDGNDLQPVSVSPREFFITRTVPEEMRFKSKGIAGHSCPDYCHPRFLRPGTCHPCITIK